MKTAVVEDSSPPVGRVVDHQRGGFWILSGGGLLALAAVLVFSLNTAAVVRVGLRLEQLDRLTQPADAPGKGACSELAKDAPPAMLDADSFCWINLVQRQAEAGDLRNRHQSADAVPAGRESHWSASFAWWLLLLAAPVHFLGNVPWPEAIAGVAAPANPILFALTLAALARWLWRRTGGWTAGVLLLTLATLWGVEWDFGYARPDHHGLHLIAFLGMLLNALGAGLGWVRTNPAEPDTDGESLVRPRAWRDARRGFLWSGFFGGMGLWIGATQQMFGLGMVGAGAALGALAWVRPGESAQTGARFEPTLWRLWARSGALTSLGFYLLEYFPAHLTVRLEVNHPLYALAWWGGGELICAAGEWAQTRRWPERAWLWRVGLGLAALGGLPLAVLAGPTTWYVLRDALLQRVMSLVSEGQPLIPHWTLAAVAHAGFQIGSLWAALPVGAALLVFRRGKLPPWRAMGLGVAVAVAGTFCGWVFLQSRWLGYAGAALAVLAVVACPGGRMRRGARGWPWGLLALTMPGALLFCAQQATLDPAAQAEKVFRWVPMTAEIGWNLRLYQGAQSPPARVIAPIGASTALRYYGGTHTLGSLYWENLEGVRTQGQFLADDQPGEPEARRIARACGLDYVVVMADPVSVLQTEWLARGQVDRAALPRSLVYRLSNPVHPNPPDWLEPLPLLDAPLAEASGARLYRVRRDRL